MCIMNYLQRRTLYNLFVFLQEVEEEENDECESKIRKATRDDEDSDSD